MGLEESRLVERDTFLGAADLATAIGLLIAKAGTSSAAQDFLEARAIFHVVEQLRELHQTHPGELLDDEGVEIVAPHLAVRDDIDAGVFLVFDRRQHGVVGDPIEFVGGDLARLAAAQRLHQPFGPCPRADHGYRKQLL